LTKCTTCVTHFLHWVQIPSLATCCQTMSNQLFKFEHRFVLLITIVTYSFPAKNSLYWVWKFIHSAQLSTIIRPFY